jgi:hypothetical protein
VIVNNTFFNNGWDDADPFGGGILDANNDPATTGVVIRNNLCFANLSFQIALELSDPGSVAVDHNLVYPFRGYAYEVRGSAYQEADPLLADAAGADFHLTAASPAIDNGSATAAPGDDFEGTERPQGSGWDIGAYEFGGVIFIDGFESGSTSSWTATVP